MCRAYRRPRFRCAARETRRFEILAESRCDLLGDKSGLARLAWLSRPSSVVSRRPAQWPRLIHAPASRNALLAQVTRRANSRLSREEIATDLGEYLGIDRVLLVRRTGIAGDDYERGHIDDSLALPDTGFTGGDRVGRRNGPMQLGTLLGTGILSHFPVRARRCDARAIVFDGSGSSGEDMRTYIAQQDGHGFRLQRSQRPDSSQWIAECFPIGTLSGSTEWNFWGWESCTAGRSANLQGAVESRADAGPLFGIRYSFLYPDCFFSQKDMETHARAEEDSAFQRPGRTTRRSLQHRRGTCLPFNDDHLTGFAVDAVR